MDVAAAYSDRGYVHRRTGNVDRALADYGEALKHNPKHDLTLLRRCWLRALANKELEQALTDCDQALSRNPKDEQIYESRCFVHYRMGNDAKALADCDALPPRPPQTPQGRQRRGRRRPRRRQEAGSGDCQALRRLRALTRVQTFAIPWVGVSSRDTLC
jgi:tetratricopeptide (TPR) repeat protein